MTVSHMYFNLNMIDASVNYESFRKNPSLKPGYDLNDPGFQSLIQSVALGSKAQFLYTPSKEDIS